MSSRPSGDPPALFAVPDAYDRYMGRYSARLAVEFAGAAGVEPGDRVLDVGCGTGELMRVLVPIVGADHVQGVDPSAPFVEAVRERLPDVAVQVGSAESLPFEDATFDAALAQLVVHFMADPAAGAAEMRRVTRPGGTVAACVWDFEGGMTLIRAYWDAALEVDPDAPDELDRFGGRRGQLAGLFRDAGLRDVQEGTLEVAAAYDDFDDLWQSCRAAVGPVGVHLASLDDDRSATLRDLLFRRVGAPDGPFELPARAWFARGIVP